MLLRKTKNNIKLICVIATIFVIYSLFEINIFLQDLNKIKTFDFKNSNFNHLLNQ